jgi:hypothetical protein
MIKCLIVKAKSSQCNTFVVEEGVDVDGPEMVPPVERQVVHVGDVVCIDTKHVIFLIAGLGRLIFIDSVQRLTTAYCEEKNEDGMIAFFLGYYVLLGEHISFE